MRAILGLYVALALTACAAGPGPDRAQRLSANPSAVIAAELAFAQLAQAKGQWTAFRETSTGDAVMFAPQMVRAQDWLRGRADPAVAVKWLPHRIWSSCDGTLGITHGAWQRPNNTVGYFTTVWQRQRNGAYKWVFDHGDVLAMPQEAPEMISAKVATCPPRRPGSSARPAQAAPFDPAARSGRSDDATLTWTVTAEPDGAHNFSAEMNVDGKLAPVVIEQVSAEQ